MATDDAKDPDPRCTNGPQARPRETPADEYKREASEHLDQSLDETFPASDPIAPFVPTQPRE